MAERTGQRRRATPGLYKTRRRDGDKGEGLPDIAYGWGQ